MAFRDSIVSSRKSFSERFNVLFKRGPKVDDDFWDDLEEALILSDVGGAASEEIVEALREVSQREALPDAFAVLDRLSQVITGFFAEADPDPFAENPVCILFVGINGAGKTTTVGKLAKHAADAGRKALIGSADTFRAAAIEQLDVWGQRSGVEVVKRERGADPASVCYDVVERSEQLGSDLVLIDTSGRLHTSDELMRELQKVVNVTRKRCTAMPVRTVLVIDATTGQNGLQQARKFNEALDLDGVIMTKLDGTAKGGIAVAVSHELGLPILGVGVGEGIDDLQPFDAAEYAQALFGDVREAAGLDAVNVKHEHGNVFGDVPEEDAAGDVSASSEGNELSPEAPQPQCSTYQGELSRDSETEGVTATTEAPEPEPEPELEPEPESAKESFTQKLKRWFM